MAYSSKLKREGRVWDFLYDPVSGKDRFKDGSFHFGEVQLMDVIGAAPSYCSWTSDRSRRRYRFELDRRYYYGGELWRQHCIELLESDLDAFWEKAKKENLLLSDLNSGFKALNNKYLDMLLDRSLESKFIAGGKGDNIDGNTEANDVKDDGGIDIDEVVAESVNDDNDNNGAKDNEIDIDELVDESANEDNDNNNETKLVDGDESANDNEEYIVQLADGDESANDDVNKKGYKGPRIVVFEKPDPAKCVNVDNVMDLIGS